MSKASNGTLVLTQRSLDGLVGRINEMTRNAVLEYAITLGRVLVEEIYGDLEGMRRRGKKDASFRNLEMHPQLAVSRSTLWRACQVYALEQSIGVSRLSNLGVTHCYAVIGLKEKDQIRLLEEANEEGWSVSMLTEQAGRLRRNRERAPKSPVVKKLGQLTMMLSQTRQDLASGGLSGPEIASVAEKVSQCRGMLSQIEALLDETA